MLKFLLSLSKDKNRPIASLSLEMDDKVSLFSNQNDNVVETEITNKIKYTDYNYVIPIESIKDVRQRLNILRRFTTRELRLKYWQKLLATGKDSAGSFIEMIKDSKEADFKFHDHQRKGEHDWVFKKLQADDNHRIEMLPENIELIDLIKDLNEVLIKNDIIFSIGKHNFFLTNILFSMKNLTWLSMSSSSITVSKIGSIVRVINRGQLGNLKAIILTNNPSLTMIELKNELKKIQRGKLQYLETDLENEEKHDLILERVDIGNNNFKFMNDGKKLKFLVESGIIKDENNKIMIDYGIVNEGWPERVRMGLADSFRGISYRVNLNKIEAALMEQVLSEKISTSTLRGGSKSTKLDLKVKKTKNSGNIFSSNSLKRVTRH